MANITRIKNNQITDQTITYTKIAPGTLVGSVFNANITLNSNVTIVGNLSVSGATTTVQSTNTYINDPLVIFNNGFASTPSYDIGILVNRNLTATAPYGSVNSAFVWQEAAKGFAGVMTTETGTTAGAINNSGYANLFIGNIFANTVTVRDTVDSTSKTTGAVLIAGGLGVAKTIYANALEGTPIGAAAASTGNFTTITSGGIQAQAIGNATPGTGAFTTLTTNSTTTFTSGTDSTSIGTGAVQISGGLSVAKNISASSAVIGTLVTTNYSTANARITGGYIDGTAIGSTSANTGAFTTLTTTSTIISGGNIVANSGTASTNNSTGALVVVGGLGANGNLNVGTISALHTVRGTTFMGNTFAGQGLSQAQLQINQNPNASPYSTSVVHAMAKDGAYGKITLDSFGTGIGSSFIARVARGNSGAPSAAQAGDNLGGFIMRGYGATNYATLPIYQSAGIFSQAAENFTDTAQGQHVYINTTPVGANVAVLAARFDSNGNVVIPSSTDSTSTATGGLVLKGGLGVAKKLYVGSDAFIGGNLTVNGTTTYVNSTNTYFEDPIIEVNTNANGAALSSPTVNDIGIKFNYYDTAARASFIGRDVDTGYFEFYDSISEASGNITGTYSTVKFGEMLLANTTISTSSSTGALRVSGGAGIAGALNVGGTFNATGAGTFSSTLGVTGATTLAGITYVTNNTVSTTPSNGALVVTGGTGIGGVLNVGGNIVATASTTSTNPTTGALVVTGGVGISGVTNHGGNVVISSGTTSTNTTTGALVITGSGGLAVGGVTNLGGNVVVSSTADVTSTTTGAMIVQGGLSAAGNVLVGNNLYVGANALTVNLTTPAIVSVDNGAAYAQNAILNRTNTGSSDWIAYGNNYAGATNDHGWSDIGFTGDAFADPSGLYTITKPNDGYFFVSGANSTVGGNLVLSTDYTGSYNDVVIGTGSFFANAEVARFHGNVSNNGTFTIKLPTNATPSANTGALQVWGGASFGGNVYHAGATILNGSMTAGFDTIVKGKNDSTLIWARPSATYDTVIIGNSQVQSGVVNGAKLQVNSTDSLLLPTGTSAQRPGSAGFTDVTGMLRYNTTLGYIEFYTGTQWNGVSTQFTVITDEQFNGDGVTVAFTLGGNSTTAATIVSINGVVQIPTLAYSVSGTTLTFTEAPSTGDVIDVRRLTTTQTVQGVASTNGYMQLQTDNNGVYVYTGSVGTSATTYWDTSGAKVGSLANVTVATASSTTTVDSFLTSAYSSAEYTITATIQGTAIREIAKINVVHDGSTAYRNVYGVIATSGNTLVTYTATISGGSVQLQATTTNNNTILRITKNYQAI